MRALQARDVGLQLVGLLDDELEERRRSHVAGDAQIADRRDLRLGLADAGRHDGAADRERAELHHRGGRREVISEGVGHAVAGAKAAGE